MLLAQEGYMGRPCRLAFFCTVYESFCIVSDGAFHVS